MLDIKDKEMIENICNLVINGGLEEERDGHSSGVEGGMKTISLNAEALRLHHSSLYLIASRNFREMSDNYLNADYSEIVSPPPEAISA